MSESSMETYWNSFLYSLISSGEDSAFAHFAANIANHYKLAFSFHQVPITAGWTKHVFVSDYYFPNTVYIGH